MAILDHQIKTVWKQFDMEDEVSAGSLGAIPGFPASVIGYTGAGGFAEYPTGTRFTVKATGQTFEVVKDGGGSPAAMLITEGSVASGKFTKVLFVDAGAPLGGDGSVSRPYSSIQAALTAATAGNAIVITAGTYVENLVMPNTDNLAIIGMGRGTTIIQQSGDAHTISWIRGLAAPAISTFEIQDLTIRNSAATATNHAIHFDGSAEVVFPGNAVFCTTFCNFERVDIERSGPVAGEAVYLNRLSYVFLRACRWYGTPSAGAALDSVAGTTIVFNCSKFEVHDASLLTSLDLTYNRLFPAPTGGRDQYLISEGSSVAPIQTNRPRNQGGTVLRASPIFLVDSTSVLSGSFSAALAAPIPAIRGIVLTAVGPGAYGPGAAPIIQCQGIVGLGSSVPSSGYIDLPMPSATLAMGSFPFLDFSRTKFFAVIAPASVPVISITSATLGGALPLSCGMRQCLFDIISSATGLPLAASVSIGSVAVGLTNVVNADICESCYSQPMFVITGTSTLDRTRWGFTAGLTLAAGPVTFAGAGQPNYPATVGSSYNVLTEVTGVAPASVAISAKGPLGFTQISTVATLGNFEIVRT